MKNEYSDFLSDNSKRILRGLTLSNGITHEQLKFLDAITFNFHAIARREIANKFFHYNAGCEERILETKDFNIKSEFDNRNICIRRYISAKKKNNAIILFIHGGGWVQGNIETHDILCRKISNIFHKEVISVDYRLSPEYKFPVPLNDVLSAYIWCINYGYKNIILAGDSVGGNLCAALCVKLNAIKYKQTPLAQILFYPILSSNLESSSYILFGQDTGLTTEWTKNYIYQYTGVEYDNKNFVRNRFVYPLFADASIFPKTWLVSASNDVLLDDQLEFAKKLKAAGIFVQQTILPGSIHGFMTYGKYFDRDITKILSEISAHICSSLIA